MEKKRDFSIDVLKFFAIFLIINSHSDIAYPRFSMLATGGAIGDCLFLFCSGYTLLLGGVINLIFITSEELIEYTLR